VVNPGDEGKHDFVGFHALVGRKVENRRWVNHNLDRQRYAYKLTVHPAIKNVSPSIIRTTASESLMYSHPTIFTGNGSNQMNPDLIRTPILCHSGRGIQQKSQIYPGSARFQGRTYMLTHRVSVGNRITTWDPWECVSSSVWSFLGLWYNIRERDRSVDHWWERPRTKVCQCQSTSRAAREGRNSKARFVDGERSVAPSSILSG